MKRISAGTVTFMMMAILFGLVSAYAVRSYLAEPKPATVDVWIASINLPKYARVTANHIRAVPTPLHRVPAGAITEQGKITSRLVANTIEAGQPVTDANLYDIDGEPTLSDKIPAGKRAVTISVTERTALSGVLLPDSLIDVSLTAEPNHPDVERAMTVTLVRGVKVLSTSQQRHRFSENSPRPLQTITVAATPHQANKLILAQQYGRLHVTLCSSTDDEAVEADVNKEEVADTVAAVPSIKTVSDSKTAGQNAVTPHELLGLDPPRVKKRVTAQIWRGTSVTEVEFQQEQIDESVRATIAVKAARAANKVQPVARTRFDANGAH